MASESRSSSTGPEISKAVILRNLVKDVATLKVDLSNSQVTLDEVTSWAKSSVKPGMQQLRDAIVSEIEGVKEFNATTDAYARGISNWIKDNLGVKLEVLDQKVAEGIEARQKASEASMWAIFSAKMDDSRTQFEEYHKSMELKHKELENEVNMMREEMKKNNALRAKAEVTIKKLEETFARLTRERADEEAQLFRKLTLKLEDERRAIEDERRKMADERKKYKHLLERHQFEMEKSSFGSSGSGGSTSSSGNSGVANNNVSFSRSNEVTPHEPLVTPPPSITLPTSSSANIAVATASKIEIGSVEAVDRPVFRSVPDWLNKSNLSAFATTFATFGYESLHIVAVLDDADLDIMGITDAENRKVLLKAAGELKHAKIERTPDEPPNPCNNHPSLLSNSTTTNNPSNTIANNHGQDKKLTTEADVMELGSPDSTGNLPPASSTASTVKPVAKRPLPKPASSSVKAPL